ncbi:MAG: hypothetical protein JJ850_06185 [Kordiimonadaceae bacterium]|nr:hypothetical protein [Kordiimonadaceae bacterium]MBO6568086.1 hypothetical protein [Kordiimonadaceae bacterium]MBO6964184.1 hypothetical protein [Kordiimonadaceae bacterium]
MSTTYFLEVNEGFDAVSNVWHKSENSVEASTLHALQNDRTQPDVVAILDGRAVVSHNIQLPNVDDAKAVKILPAVIDDKLALAGGENHLALLSAASGDGERLVGVVSNESMQALRTLLNRVGINAGRAIPDYLLLETKPDLEQVCALDDRVLVRRPDGSGYAIDKSEADWILGKVDALPLDWSAALANYFTGGGNLLQGLYAPRTNWRTTFLWWRRAAILASLAVVMAVMSFWYGASQNYKQADQLYLAAEQAFRNALPDEPRIINMDAQLRRAIASRGQRGGGEFFTLSTVVMQVVENNEQTVLETLRYEQADSELALDVSFSSFADSSNFKQQLEAAGMQVSEGSSRQEGGRVLSEIRVRRP